MRVSPHRRRSRWPGGQTAAWRGTRCNQRGHVGPGGARLASGDRVEAEVAVAIDVGAGLRRQVEGAVSGQHDRILREIDGESGRRVAVGAGASWTDPASPEVNGVSDAARSECRGRGSSRVPGTGRSQEGYRDQREPRARRESAHAVRFYSLHRTGARRDLVSWVVSPAPTCFGVPRASGLLAPYRPVTGAAVATRGRAARSVSVQSHWGSSWRSRSSGSSSRCRSRGSGPLQDPRRRWRNRSGGIRHRRRSPGSAPRAGRASRSTGDRHGRRRRRPASRPPSSRSAGSSTRREASRRGNSWRRSPTRVEARR